MTQMAGGAEFDLIRALLERWGPLARGVGDDAAEVMIPRGEMLIASVDAAVEGRHFRDGWLSPREVGYRAVTAALSDLAAMAAAPSGVLLAFVIPPQWIDRLDDVASGIGDAVATAGTVIVGGNVAAGDAFAITTTVLGHTFAPLRRSGARAGDGLYVTGRLGGPGAAVAALAGGREPDPLARARFARPVARIAEARWLARHGATAAIDLSDGLAGDLQHLAAASGVAIDVDVERIPALDGVTATDAIASGEEYEIVVTAPADLDVDAFARRFDLPLTRIGIVIGDAPDGAVQYHDRGARVVPGAGHDHFSA